MTARCTIALALASLIASTSLIASACTAMAERLVASMSNHRVMVSSSYTGEELVLFGSVERDAASVPRRGPYDIIATITGPRQSLRTRRKERVLGIWVNVSSREFVNPPSYLAVLQSHPLDTITNAENQKKLQLGIANTPLPEMIYNDLGDVSNDPFRGAFVRLMRERGLFDEEPNAITFLTPTLFRASVPLPAEVPVGNYEVDVKLFADGNMIARTNSAFEIVKVGIEQFVVTAARDHSILYGIAAAMMALLTGWIASVVFRRD